ncbi:MAG: 2-oxopent-4-enoate hydratase [Acidimicrobiales bacterium]|nr:MAG: 2-oxopent-4-enoate hydratase [Acidimicrobiales bacterium]
MGAVVDYKVLGQELFDALASGQAIDPLTAKYPDLSIDDAYEISLAFLDNRQKTNGEKVIGKKIGVTSKPVQEMLGVFQPDFGFLTDAMLAEDGKVYMDCHIAPRAEAEIAFKLKKHLKGPGVTPADVIDATEYVQPCFEIVDSRIKDWKIVIGDTVADNASCGVFVLGAQKVDPSTINMAELEVVVHKNGDEISRGVGSSVQGAPENAVAWLANTLGAYDIPFKAGEIILSGSLVPLEPVV